MANPTLTKKVNNNVLIATDDIKRLFQAIYYEQKESGQSDDEVPKIKVSSLISKMAFYYEKVRNTVDYREEHLLRENAIERILRRQIIIEGTISIKKIKSRDIAKHLLVELIRAAYLPNNKIPEAKIDEISQVIDKYLELKQYSLQQFKNSHQIKEKNKIIKWIIALAASDIEERLGRSQVDLVVIDYLYKILNSNIKLPDAPDYKKDREIQIYVGIYRNFLKFDHDMLRFILFKYFNPNWHKATNREIREIAKNITSLLEDINYQIDHPLASQLNRIIIRYTVFFTMLIDVIKDDPPRVYENFKRDPKVFSRQVKKICAKRYKQARIKLWRAAVRSILYIFITKSIFAIMLEVPAVKWFGQEVNTFSLIINISFPAVLLFFIILFTKLPSDANSDKIIDGIEEIAILGRERKEPFRLRRPVERGRILNTIFGIFYAVTFFLSFGFVVWGLDKIGFYWISIVIFLFFLAFVSFFSIRIRKNARELMIIEPKENIFSLLADFFYVPIVSAGKWMSEKFSHINIFVFVLDFIIEAPFKIFVEIAEEWTKYVRERKDEIV